MEKITTSEIIKELVNSRHNPLTDDFVFESFIKDFEMDCAKVGINLNNTTNGNNAIELIDAIQTINFIYKEIMDSIKTAFDDIDLSMIDFIDYILAIANFEYIRMSLKQIEALTSDNNTAPIRIDRGNEYKLKNIFGEELDINDALDITLDIQIELIRLSHLFLKSRPSRKKKTTLESENLERIRYLSYLVNLLVNLNGAFQFYQYEFSEIEYKNEILKFKNSPEIYYLLRLAGKQRGQNLIREIVFYLSDTQELYPKIINTVSNGVLHIEFKESKDSIIAKHESAVMIKFYYHLLNKKLKSLGGITIQELFKFIIGLKLCFSELKDKDVIDKTVSGQSNKFIPRKIEKVVLTKALQKTSKLDIKIINILLAKISQYSAKKFSFWKTPLLQFGNWYYFAIGPIANGHTSYIIDHLLDKSLSLSEQEELFTNEIRDELPYIINSNYHFKIIDKWLDIDIPKNMLLFELKNIFFLVRAFIFKYPNESDEYKEAISLGILASEELNAFKKVIQRNTQKTIVSALVSNYPNLSGLNLELNMVIDYTLLKNYLNIGKYARGIAISGDGKVETEELASIKYYNNEDEFNKNLQWFLYEPNHIREIINYYEHKEHSIFPEHIPYKVFRDGAEAITFESEIALLIKELEFTIKQLFYFDDHYDNERAVDEKNFYQDRINFILPQVLNYVALDKSEKNNRLYLLGIIKKIKINAFGYLILVINNALSELEKKKIEKLEVEALENIDHEKGAKDLDYIFEECLKGQKEISLLEITINHKLNPSDVINLKKHILILISSFNHKYYTDEEMQVYLTLLAVFVGLGFDKRFEEHFYTCALNFIDALNYNYHFQKARNFAEEILMLSFQRDQIPLLGWLCQFKCFIKQNNPIEAAYYGSLYINCLRAMPIIEEFQLIEVLFNSMLFFRDCGINDIVNSIYELIKTLKLSTYDEQKFTISYFSSNLSKVLHEDSIKQEQFLQNSLSYIDENLNEIKKFGNQGAIPWLGFLYNLKRMKDNFETPLDIDVLEKYIISFEEEIDSETLSNMQATFFPITEQTKKVFKIALIKILETYNYEDFANETGKIELLAENVLLLSLNPLDINSILLSGFIINDNSLSFEEREHVDRAPFIPQNEPEFDLDDYAKNILEKITIYEGQIICWLFTVKSNIYGLVVREDKSYELNLFSNFDYEIIKKWSKKVEDFSFDDKGGWYSINEQEQDYITLMKELRNLVFEISSNTKEVLLITDLQLSVFPHNLLQVRTEGRNIEKHEEIVKIEILNNKLDFLGYHLPITNIISFEWFAKNNKKITIEKNNFTINAWIPIYDEDPALGIGYEKLKPVIEEKYGGHISTDKVPERSVSSINVLLAHGGVGKEGFKTIYTRQSEGHAYIRETGIKHIVGEGTIAILFVCSSAYISQEMFAQKLESFTNEILSVGYKVVVAPAWKLNPDITPVWLEAFIESMHNGNSVATGAYDANIKVAKTGYDEYNGFYAPSGWAAMHVYGNPNIFIK